ncbi:MAG: NUDIX hydrolase [Chloroflexi bacterium]|nr:NUDIX hydrolase [Chloroflexota bacterium]
MPIKRVRENVVYENRWVRLYDDLIEHPDGSAGTYSWVERNNGRGGAIVVPRLPDGRVLLLKMHRYVPDRWSWEFPGGGTDAGESVEETALRELLEEAGLQGAEARVLGRFSSDTGFIRVRHAAVLVELPDGAEDGLRLDAQESVTEARFVTERDAWDMVGRGDIFDGITVTALGMLKAAAAPLQHGPARPGADGPAGAQPRRLRAKLMYDSPWWRLYEDDIVRPDGSAGIYVRVHTSMGGGAIMVIPRTPSRRHLLIKIHRYPVDEELWEFPAGLVEEGEDPLVTATRELEEETGLVASSATMIGSQFPVAGLMSDTFYTVLAEVPEPESDVSGLALQADEGIVAAKFVTLDELAEMVRENEIRDGVTLGAVARLLAADMPV